jgi:hypothetical protein
VIIGAGGYAQEVAWIIDDLNMVHAEWHLLGFMDTQNSGRLEHYGRPVLDGYAAASSLCTQPFFACGMGTPAIRCQEARRAENLGWQPAALVHPSVIQAKFVSVGEGSTIGAGASVHPGRRIGAGTREDRGRTDPDAQRQRQQYPWKMAPFITPVVSP